MSILKKIGIRTYLWVSLVILLLSLFIAHPSWLGFVIINNSTIDTNISCDENWVCGDWSVCDGSQSRSCVDKNGCNTTHNLPILEKSCYFSPLISHQKLIWDGESAISREWTFSNADVVQNRIHQGQYALMFSNPTPPFSKGTMEIAVNDSNYGLDLSNFDEISFYVRGDSAGESFYFKINGFSSNEVSNEVNLNDYISGGSIDRSYRLVTIPLDSLKNKFNLDKIRSFTISSSQGGLLYLDDFYALDSSIPKISNLELNSSKSFKISLNDPCNISFCSNLSNYELYGLYDASNKLNPSTISFISNPDNSEYAIIIGFNSVLKNNLNYSLIITNLSDDYNNYLSNSTIYHFNILDNTLTNLT
ncbi:MAG: hypothetical protein WCK29_02570 [archaeon]